MASATTVTMAQHTVTMTHMPTPTVAISWSMAEVSAALYMAVRNGGKGTTSPCQICSMHSRITPPHVAQPAELAGPADAGLGSVGELIAVLIDDTALHLLFLDDGTNGSNGNGLAASNNKTSHKKSPLSIDAMSHRAVSI